MNINSFRKKCGIIVTQLTLKHQPMMSPALLVTMEDLNGLNVVEVTIESVLCSCLEEDAMEEKVDHVHHVVANLELVMESDCCQMSVESMLMKTLHCRDI